MPEPVGDDTLSEILDLARRAPSAGNTSAVEFLVLSQPAAVAHYWSTTFTPEKRATFAFPGLFAAPAIVILTTRPEAYVQRYSEPDKKRTGLGDHPDAWTVPYWWVDAGAVIQNLLLLVQTRNLAACLFGLFDHEDAVRKEFGVPSDRRVVAGIAIGYDAGDRQQGRSASRPRAPIDQITFWQEWPAPR
ncbi:MAG: nitroreductase family protein [Acidimicrobiales bacterium]|nr:nitroreductase family protein [Acidimicrobiales bacterium]